MSRMDEIQALTDAYSVLNNACIETVTGPPAIYNVVSHARESINKRIEAIVHEAIVHEDSEV